VWHLLFVSFPEELFLILIVLAMAGKKEAFDFTKIRNIFLPIMMSVCFITVTEAANYLGVQDTYKLLLIFVTLFASVFFVYRINIGICLLSCALSVLVIIIAESVFLTLIAYSFDMMLDQMQRNTVVKFVCTLPERILQITVLIILLKFKSVPVKRFDKKLEVKDWMIIGLFVIAMISNMKSIESGIKQLHYDPLNLAILISNIIIMIILTVSLVYKVILLQKKVTLKAGMHNVDLFHIRTLIEEGKSDYAIQLIDMTLDQNDYFKE
jgi:hypothetical protein